MRQRDAEKQKKVLEFVNHQVASKGYPPSVREICEAVGFKSTSTVHAYLKRLEEDGQIVKDPTKPRALRVQSPGKTSLEGFLSDREIENVPLIGRVTAGMPILAVENVEETFPIPVSLLGNAVSFLLRVRGDSMINAGILDGDAILVRQQDTALNGEMVVALIDDEATVKTFYKEKDHIRLQPENDDYEPIRVTECAILGKVVGLIRQY